VERAEIMEQQYMRSFRRCNPKAYVSEDEKCKTLEILGRIHFKVRVHTRSITVNMLFSNVYFKFTIFYAFNMPTM
jgi:hypothetical protein